MTSRSDLIPLRAGPIITLAALRLALALEDAGHALSVVDGTLRVTNGSTLTAEERAAIKAQRFHLMAIAAYRMEAV